MTSEELNRAGFDHGDRVTCEIKGKKIKDARLSYEEETDSWYVCQDKMAGSVAYEKFGYEFSWFVDDRVTNLRYAGNGVPFVDTNEYPGMSRAFTSASSEKPEKYCVGSTVIIDKNNMSNLTKKMALLFVESHKNHSENQVSLTVRIC